MVNVDSGYMLKIHEPAPYVLASKDLWLGHVYLLAMNSNAWDELAQEDKDAIRRAAETAYKALGQVMDSSFDAMLKDLANEGVKIRLLEDNEGDAFETAVKYQDVQAAWVRAQEAKGVKDAGPTMEQVRAVLKDAVK
jgi:TRAP-type C4-dicarboxylate transport system substrate-binding protein